MALIIEGSSICSICNTVLDQHRKYMLTPALMSNMLDDLWQVNDCGIHIDCIEHHPLKEKLFYHIDIIDKLHAASEKKCIVDQQPITNAQDFFNTYLLTSNLSEALYRFNYLMINRHNISRWKQRAEFIAEANRFIAAGKWKGFMGFNYLQNRLDEIYAHS